MKKIYFIFLLVFPLIVFSQASKYHYIPPLTTINGENTNPQAVEIFISTPSSSAVNYTIWPLPLDNSTKYNGTLSKLSPGAAVVSGTDYYISSSGYGQLIVPHTDTGSVTTDKGYYIEADELIYVNVRYKADAQAGALVSKGEAALGTSFRAGGFANQRVDDNGYMSYISVLATEEGTTTVTFSDIAGGENSDRNWMDFINVNEIYGGSGEVSDIVITLNQFESFILANRMNSGNIGSGTNNGIQGAPYPDSNNDGIIGTAIDSDKKIAVVVGGANGSMTSTHSGRDNGVDQIVGADKIGNEFIFIRGNPTEGTRDYDDAIIVANENGTEVFLNGSLTATATLNAGDYFVIDEEDYDTGTEASGAEHNIYVRTSKNAYAYQFISNGQSANTEMFFVPALSCTSLENAEYIPDIEKVGGTNYNGYVIIVAPATASITFTDKNNTTAKWTGDSLTTASLVEGPDPVTGKPEYVTYKLQNLEGNVSVFSSNSDGSQAELYAAYYGSSGVATQGAFYSGFPMPPENKFNAASIAGSGNCIPNVSLTIPNDNLYDSIEWEYWDGNGVVNYNTVPGWTTKTVTPTQVGFYKAVGVISCTSKIYRLESSVKKVSNCPLDLDGDGIINNIDVDIDNDGIYNTIESKAIDKLDISTLNDPIIVFSDTSTDTSIPSALYTNNDAGATLTGQTSGAFESSLTSGNKQGTYTVSFTQPVNFVLDEDVNFTHTLRNGEKYSVSILPVSLTITLLDPGDELKIDTNQNGVYDSGIVTITSNEILFTFNSSTSASDKFSFQADGITQFTFKHIADGTSGNSVFNGVMSMKYLPIDTDSDLIYNIYDYDSDADGCFDTIEAGFTDGDSNGKIGIDPIVVDGMLATEPGKVNNQGQGYTTPNDLNTNGVQDFLEYTVSPTFTIEPQDVKICPGDNTSFTASSSLSDTVFLWQRYNTATSVWDNLANGAIYSGVTSPTLTLTAPDSNTLDDSLYRVVISKDEFVCFSISATATLNFVQPGVTTFGGGSLSVTEGGANDIFSFALTDQPSSTVTINLTTAPASQFTLTPSSFNFDSSNWSTSQSATLSAVDDLIVDGTVTGTLTLAADPSSDNCFDNIGPLNFNVAIIDNDTAGYIVNPVIGTLTESDTTTASFTVVLNRQPINDVIINLTNSDASEKNIGTTTLTFTNANWNVSQTIILNSVDDLLVDGDLTTSITAEIDPSSDSSFTGLASQTVTVVTKDNEIGDFVLGPISGNLTEQPLNSVNFSVILTAIPSSNVEINFSSGDLTEASMATTSVTFTPANWNIPILVGVDSVDELIFDGDQTTIITASVNPSSDSSFTGASSKTVSVITEDNDAPGFTVNPVVGSLTESNTITALFSVVLNSTPTSDVIIDLNNTDSSEIVLDKVFLTFTSINWNIPQIITLFSEDDYIIDGTQTTSITASVNNSSDPDYISLSSQTVSVVTYDNEIAGAIVTVLDNLTSEDGDTGYFEILLTAQPNDDVTINLSSSNILEGKLINNSVTFTPSNWNTPQIITVEGVDDSPPTSDGSIDFKIITGNVNSSDPDFDLLDGSSIPDANMTNQDNDAPGILVTILNNDFTTSESGDIVIVQFSLLSKPNGGADVTIPLSLSGPSGEMNLNETSITILNNNWDNPSANQITITGLDDLLVDGDKQVYLITGDPTSGDSFHNDLNAESVANPLLTNEDNDIPTIIVSTPDSVSEDGTTSLLNVRLGTNILSNVNINLSLSDITELDINKNNLTFSSLNWNIDQQITITGQDDLILDGDISSVIYLNVDALNSDSSYQSVARVNVFVINIDNEEDFDNDLIEGDDDNCIDISNPEQKDLDQDGTGDLCDIDIDGDGVLNVIEELDKTDPKNACSFNSSNITLEVTIKIDCDGDGTIDENDLDSDNDGILDSNEGNDDIDNDGIPNYLDLDSDGDNCPDVIEAGFEDGDNDGILGSSPLSFDSFGKVISSSGYTIPNDLDSNGIADYLEFGSEIKITKQPKPINPVNPGRPISLSVDAESEGTRSYKWQVNNNTQSISSKKQSWVSINDSNLYSGTETNILIINNPSINMIGWKYRVIISNPCYVCGEDVISEESLLSKIGLNIPNAFSPDGDGVNDKWVIEGLEYYTKHYIRIYNRWEAKVFESINYQNDWDGIQTHGTTLGNDKNLPEGVYFYIIELGEIKEPIRGFVYIKRKKW